MRCSSGIGRRRQRLGPFSGNPEVCASPKRCSKRSAEAGYNSAFVVRTDFKADFKLAVFEPFDKVSNRFVWRRAVQIVQPATIVSWHRRMFAWHWRWR